jgi:hypothetical protein
MKRRPNRTPIACGNISDRMAAPSSRIALHQFLPNVKAWRPSLDVTNPDGSVTHTYIAGWLGILALDHIETVIINDNSLAFALDRNGPPYVIKNNIGSVITDIAVSPVFAGSHYPLGGLS